MLENFSATTCIVLLLAIFGVHSAKLPSSFHRCHKSDPKFDECLQFSVEDAISKLKDPAPEVGLNSLEPLLINELIIGQGTGPVNVQQNFHNVKLHGLTKSKVISHKAMLEKNMLFAQSITPELRLEADYEMSGRVLLLPIYGNGPCNVTLQKMHINHTLHGSLFEKKGKTFMRIEKYDVTLKPERVIFNFANLFNGDERLGNEINKVLNENWDAVYGDVMSGYEKSFGLIFKNLANQVFTRVPLKDIYLD